MAEQRVLGVFWPTPVRQLREQPDLDRLLFRLPETMQQTDPSLEAVGQFHLGSWGQTKLLGLRRVGRSHRKCNSATIVPGLSGDEATRNRILSRCEFAIAL